MNKIIIELKWAIVFTLMSLAWILLEKTLGWHEDDVGDYFWFTLLFFPIAAFMGFLQMKEKRRRYYLGVITYKQALISGITMSVFVALLSPLAQYIMHNYITPEYFVNVTNYSVTRQLITIEAANELFNINSYMWKAAVGALLVGVITSVFLALIVRRKVAKLSRKERRQLKQENLSGEL